MGGRRPSSLEKIVGKSKKVAERKRSFFQAVKSEKPENIVSSAVDLLVSSDDTINNLYQATKFLDFINETKYKKAERYTERKEEAAKKWAEIKKKGKLKTSSETDRIFVESAAKVIRRGAK